MIFYPQLGPIALIFSNHVWDRISGVAFTLILVLSERVISQLKHWVKFPLFLLIAFVWLFLGIIGTSST